MSAPFGPQLIGETEKTLNALLHQFLEGTGLTEREWVTLRIAATLDSSLTAHDLAVAVGDRAHFSDATALVSGLTDHGLLIDGQLTPAGRELTATTQAKIAAATVPIWDTLPANDVAAATRVLNEVITRARGALAD